MSCGLYNVKKQEYSVTYSQIPKKIGMTTSTLVTLSAVGCCITKFSESGE